MSRFLPSPSVIAAAAAFTCLTAGPVLAQSNQNNSTNSQSNHNAANNNSNADSQNVSNSSAPLPSGNHAPPGTLAKSDGDWRASQLVGATVYNSDGKSIGTINDLLVSSNGTISNAIISVGGFLGIGQKLVEVPFSQIKFAPSKSNPASGSKVSSEHGATGAEPAPMRLAEPENGIGAAGTAGGMSPGVTGTPPGAGVAPGSEANGGATGTVSSPMALARQAEYSATLPGATQKSLKADPSFSFTQ